jgi:hypothetical protein
MFSAKKKSQIGLFLAVFFFGWNVIFWLRKWVLRSKLSKKCWSVLVFLLEKQKVLFLIFFGKYSRSRFPISDPGQTKLVTPGNMTVGNFKINKKKFGYKRKKILFSKCKTLFFFQKKIFYSHIDQKLNRLSCKSVLYTAQPV